MVWCRSFSLRHNISGSHPLASRFQPWTSLKKSISPPWSCYLSRRENEIRKEGRRTRRRRGSALLVVDARSVCICGFHVDVTSFFLSRRSCLTHLCQVRVDLSFSLSVYVPYLHRASCVTTHVYIFPVEAWVTVTLKEKLTRYAIRLSRRLLSLTGTAYFFLSTSNA